MPTKRRVALLTVPIPRVPELGSEIAAGSTLLEALSLSLRVGLDQAARCEPPQLPPQNLSLVVAFISLSKEKFNYNVPTTREWSYR